MAVTQLIRLDQSTLEASIYSTFQSSSALTLVAADCYKFEFEPIVLLHALQLLSLDPSRYGIDLQDYLAPVVQYYVQHCPSQFTDLSFGTTDFKRRAAENLGVAMASLIMVAVLNVRRESITQIHSAKKLRGRKPDFVAYSGSNGYVFEAKGTSRPQTIGKQIKDASDQLNSTPLGGKGKIGFASFFPGEVGSLLPSTHLFDPPSKTLIPDSLEAVLRHYVHKLSLLELNESMKLLSDYVDSKLFLEIMHDDNVWQRARAKDKTESLKSQFVKVFSDEAKSLEQTSTKQGEFFVRAKNIIVKDRKVRFVASCHREFLDPFSPTKSSVTIETSHSAESHNAESTFSDGTRIWLGWK